MESADRRAAGCNDGGFLLASLGGLGTVSGSQAIASRQCEKLETLVAVSAVKQRASPGPSATPRGGCGGTRISATNAAFCKRLGWELAGEERLTIVTSGFRHFANHPG